MISEGNLVNEKGGNMQCKHACKEIGKLASKMEKVLKSVR